MVVGMKKPTICQLICQWNEKRPTSIIEYQAVIIFFVVPPGFEPRHAEPKSGVLPLHHGTILLLFRKAMQRYCFLPRLQNFSM